ncbi:hypothetical protein CVT26_006295, partial [Gymnopilus dilepis]
SEDIQGSLQTNVAATFPFARGAIQAFNEDDIEEANGKRGAPVFTGATASIGGNVLTSAFSASEGSFRAWQRNLERKTLSLMWVSPVCAFFDTMA